MFAMQYSYTLPADYDMSIIKQRIATKGHLMDSFPQLAFKAFMYASRNTELKNIENLYAPFYLWESNEGMNSFLASSGFAALTDSFGWPSITTWSVWQSQLQPTLITATYATREVVQIQPYTSLADLRKVETENVSCDIEKYGALGAIVGFEPSKWALVRFRLWQEYGEIIDRSGVQVYEVGHMSIPNNQMIMGSNQKTIKKESAEGIQARRSG